MTASLQRATLTGTVPTHPAHRAEHRGDDKGTLAAVVVPGALLSTLLTAWHYSSKPMWRDEWFTFGTAERTLPQMARLLSRDDGGLSGFYLFMHAWMTLGESLAWVRLPAAITTVALTVLTALVGRRLGGTLTGALAGVVVAVLPSVTDHAQEARAYPLVIAATTATALAALHYRERPSPTGGAVFAVLALLAVVMHPLPGAPAVAGIVLGLLLVPGAARRTRVVLLAVPAGLASLVVVAWGASQGGDSANPGGLRSLGFLLRLRFAVAPTWPLLAALVLLSVVGTAALLTRRSSEAVLILAWIAVPVATITGSTLVGSFYEGRYLSAVVPAAAVLVAVGSVAVGRTVSASLSGPTRQADSSAGACWASPAVAVGLVAVLAFAYLPQVTELRRSPFMADDPRSAGAYLTAESRPGDAVVYSGSMARGLTKYYAPTATGQMNDALLTRLPVAAGSISGTEVTPARRPAEVADAPRIWVVGTMSSSGWRAQQTVDDVTEGFTFRERKDFGGWVVERWDRAERRNT